METIYIVTSGEYSDYGINGVFTTEEKAQSYNDKYNRLYIYDIWAKDENHAVKIANERRGQLIATNLIKLNDSPEKYIEFKVP